MANSKATRYWPDWTYELPEELLSAMDEYHILKVPLLGQHYPGGPSDWCGRTSSSIAFNYYQLAQGGDVTSKFITHWNAGQPGHFVDLRYPGGQRAFHTIPTDPPHNTNVPGYSIHGDHEDGGDGFVVKPPVDFELAAKKLKIDAGAIMGFTPSVILPYAEPNRQVRAAEIASSPQHIASRLETLLKALTSNNPVILYSGFSMSFDSPIHLILIAGYAYINDDSGRHLWLAIADPATHEKKIKCGMLVPPTPEAKTDIAGLKSLSGHHDFIRVVPGDWENAKGALVLIRARKLFEDNKQSTARGDLYMDYSDPDKKGGTFLYSHRWTPVPPELLYTNVMRSVAFPVDDKKERFRPSNFYVHTESAGAGLFPIGSQRNLHSGVHLERSRFAPAGKAVRSMAPGYVVAVRMVSALPTPPAEAKASAKPNSGVEKNQLAQELGGNHNSFILVRHDLEEVIPQKAGQKSSSEPERFGFYSLYMHLAPPDWNDATTYQDVAWLKTLARRDGCATVLDPALASFQQVPWLQRPPDGQSLGDTSKLAPLTGGTLITMGAGLGQPQNLELGEPKDDVVRAVWKKPDRDLQELHDALRNGEIVTIPHPYLKVRAGELLGYLDSQSRDGEGFLHWEVFGPSSTGQLKEMLEFAEDKLGLGRGFFKFYEETGKPNNFFEPPALSGKEGELDELLKLAPVSKHTGDQEKTALDSFRTSYDVGVLQSLLASHRGLAFTEEEEPDSAEADYPVEVRLENFHNCMPPGSYALKFTFEPAAKEQVVPYDGKQASVRIRMPARARKIFVEPQGFFLQAGGGTDPEALKKDVKHFRNMAGTRWRNVILRHINDWSVKGIAEQLKAHLAVSGKLQVGDRVLDNADPKKVEQEIQELAKSVAWWGHASEKAVLGPEEQGDPLFTGSPSNDDQLPEDTFLDHANPVTVTWVLMLLARHSLARFTEKPIWRSEDMKKVAACCWLPARPKNPPMRLGEHIKACAIQRGNGGEPVKLKMTGAVPLELGEGKFVDGLFVQPMDFPAWGKWMLENLGGQVLGSLEVEGLRPTLMKAQGEQTESDTQSGETPDGPVRLPDGKRTWRIPFRRNCPRFLRGWVTLRCWKGGMKEEIPQDPSQFTIEMAIPIEAREDTAFNEQVGFAVVDGFVTQGTVKSADTYITEHFTYKMFLDAAKKPAKPAPGAAAAPAGPPKLAWELVEAVEHVQREYSPRQLLTLSALAEDGLSLQLKATDMRKLKEKAHQVMDTGWIDFTVEEKPGTFRIAVAPPKQSRNAGEVVLGFDPNPTFAELRKKLSPGQQLAVRFGVFFPNGGGALDPRLRPADTVGVRPVETTLAELKALAQAGYLELGSTAAPEVLHVPGFGTPTWKLTQTGLQCNVELIGGDAHFWGAAVPVISFSKLEELKKSQSKIVAAKNAPLSVSRHVAFKDAKNAQLVIYAEPLKKEVPLGPEKITVANSPSVAYDTTASASLEIKPKAEDAYLRLIELTTHAVPLATALKVELETLETPPGAKKRGTQVLKLARTALRYKQPRKDAGGLMDPEGVFRAELDLRDVAAALRNLHVKQCKLRVMTAAQGDAYKDVCAKEQVLELPPELMPEEPKPEPPRDETVGTRLSNPPYRPETGTASQKT